jgi:hypothetical protein
MRFRRDELMSFKIVRLKEIMRELAIDIPRHCLDKSELVTAMIDSGKIRLAERLPPTAVALTDVQENMSLSQLRTLLVGVGIDTSSFLEKKDFREAVLKSDRFIVTDDTDTDDTSGGGVVMGNGKRDADEVVATIDYAMEEEAGEEEEGEGDGAESWVWVKESSPIVLPPVVESIAAAPHTMSTVCSSASCSIPIPVPVECSGSGLSVKELLGVAEAFNVNVNGCLEREDLVHRLQAEGLFDGI